MEDVIQVKFTLNGYNKPYVSFSTLEFQKKKAKYPARAASRKTHAGASPCPSGASG